MNYFSLMMRKRLKPDENPEAEDPDEAKTKKSSSKNKSKGKMKLYIIPFFMKFE